MAAQGAWYSRDTSPGPGWAERAQETAGDYATLLWRERRLRLVVFAVLFVIGAVVAFTLKTSYPAHSSVLVRLGPEYVYEPSTGDAGRGTAPDNGQLIQSETEILTSGPLKQRVVDRLGLSRIYPDLAPKYAAGGLAQKKAVVATAI